MGMNWNFKLKFSNIWIVFNISAIRSLCATFSLLQFNFIYDYLIATMICICVLLVSVFAWVIFDLIQGDGFLFAKFIVNLWFDVYMPVVN